jgi:hypothetical protein
MKTRLTRKPSGEVPSKYEAVPATELSETQTPQDVLLLKLVENPDMTPIVIRNPPTNVRQFDQEIYLAFTVLKAAASKGQPHELTTIVRRIGQSWYGLTKPIRIYTEPELMSLSSRVRSSGIQTFLYPDVLTPPTKEDERRDMVFLGYGDPNLLAALGDRLRLIFKPRSHMEVYHEDSKFRGAIMVVMYGLFEEELASLGVTQNPLWKEYLEAVEEYVEGLEVKER